ncbi:hypothetical protein EDC01DRAFT_784593 [Geopyxis carbonaria]|nr:hypothetical protein EDC01DRAFT_784593 [Geopyxis carbonaria]
MSRQGPALAVSPSSPNRNSTTPSKPPAPLLITLLGGPASGKTSLLTSHFHGHMSALHVPTLHAYHILRPPLHSADPCAYEHAVLYPRGVAGFQVSGDVRIHATEHGGAASRATGPEEFPKLEEAEVVVVCVSLVDRAGLEAVRTKWRGSAPGAKPVVVLVGTKKDLRGEVVPAGEGGLTVVLRGELERVAEARGWRVGGECSSVTEWGMKEVWWNIVDAGLGARRERKERERARREWEEVNKKK